jgi:peptide-methionine (S)-S-oxide reductase
MGGNKSDPTYKEVCTGTTNHAEVVEVIYDSSIVSYEKILAEFWVMHDPTSLNQQGGDIGTQYRSAIFTSSNDQMDKALASKKIYQDELSKNGMDKIVTEITPASNTIYWLAEEYHQKYLIKNPNGYDCHSSTGIAYPLVTSGANE